MCRHKLVEEPEVERTARKVHERGYSVLLRLAFIVVMMMVMVVMMLFFLVLMVFMLMMVLSLFVVMLMLLLFLVFVMVKCVFHLANPRSRCCHAVEIEQSRLQ